MSTIMNKIKTTFAIFMLATAFTSNVYADSVDFATNNINHELSVTAANCSMDLTTLNLDFDKTKLGVEFISKAEVPLKIFNPAGLNGSIYAEFQEWSKTSANEDVLTTVSVNNYFSEGGTSLASPFGTQSFADLSDDGKYTVILYIEVKAVNNGKNVFFKEGTLSVPITIKQTC